MNTKVIFALFAVVCMVAADASANDAAATGKKSDKRGVLGLGGYGAPASPYGAAAGWSPNALAGYPGYNPWAVEDPATAGWAAPGYNPNAWFGARSFKHGHITPAAQAANDLAASLTAAKEATAAAALAQQRVAVAKETLQAQQRIAAAKESAAAAAIQRSEAAAAAAAAIQRSEAAHAAAAAIQRSAASAAHASAASAAAAAAAATPLPSHGGGHSQWLAAKKAAEWAAWG